MVELDQLINADTIVLADVSYSSLWVTGFLTARVAGQRFLTPRGLAGLGWGFPMAHGAKVAASSKKVVALVGDGGFGHCWPELETARRMGLSVRVIMLNNGILGFQKHAELVKSGVHTGAVTFAKVNHAAIVRAAGCHGIRVDSLDAHVPALKQAQKADGTTLIDVLTSPDAHPPITAFQTVS